MQIHSGVEGWGAQSRILALALQTMEDESGAEGFPIADEMDDMVGTWFKAEVHRNYAVGARQQYMRDHGKDLEPGEFVVIRDTRPESTRRIDPTK